MNLLGEYSGIWEELKCFFNIKITSGLNISMLFFSQVLLFRCAEKVNRKCFSSAPGVLSHGYHDHGISEKEDKGG